ncbi:uncharacterized protein [Pleurodeles waltl]|uniref:uncharacterized protein isoform X1 n=1 Tax=Pleurodeles waltl TaxID=8319 RepID=UPI00370986A0
MWQSGSAGRLKRVLRELQEEEITEKRCKEKIKPKQSGQDMIKVTNQTPAERTASQPGDASSQINLQKLQNLALLAGMATVLHSKSTSEYEAERENETVLETPLQFKDQGLKHAFSSPRHQFIPKQLFPMQELGSSSNQVTPPRPCKRDHKMMIHLAPKVSTKQNFMDHNSRSHSLTSSEFPSFPSAARVKEVDVNHTHHHADTFSNESTAHDDIEDPDKSFHLTTEESPSFHTGEMEYSSLSIINQNESYSVAHGSCLNETCVQLQAEVNALQAENEHLKAQLQGTCNNELAVQHLRAALSALTSSRNLTYTATSQICSGSFSVQKTDMQQLVKDSNDPDLFRNVLVPKRELHKLLEEAKAARDSACFLLNGVSEVLFSPKELAAAKGVTKACAGTAALDEEKVDALFEFMKSENNEKEAGYKNLQC